MNILRLFLLVGLLTTTAQAATKTENISSVKLYSVAEETLPFDTAAENPFKEVDLDLDVQAPASRQPQTHFNWFGFYDGNGQGGQQGNIWKYRMLFDAPGRWTITATFRDAQSGKPLAPARIFAYEVAAQAAPGQHGHVTRDPHNPMRLAFADGTPWVPFSMHASFLLDQKQDVARQWIDQHAALGVNALGVRFHAEAGNAFGFPGHWQFLSTDGQTVTNWPAQGADGFDYECPDVGSWCYNEELMSYAYEHNIRLHIWFGMSGDNRQYHSYGPQDWIKDGELGPQQNRFIRYFVARWAPLPVWWHWTVDSEYEEGPGDDAARDRAWAAELQRLNPWPTLITTHVLRQWTLGSSPEYDLATTQLRVPALPSQITAASVGFVNETAVYGIPVFNAEGVWGLPNVDSTRIGTLAHYFAGGFSHVAHDGNPHTKSCWGCVWDEVTPRHQEDAALLGRLSRFFNDPAQADLNTARPAAELLTLAGGRNALCLADPGRIYAVWLDEGGTATINLSDDPAAFSVTRHEGNDPAGTAIELPPVQGGGAVTLPAARASGFGHDVIYLLRAVNKPTLRLLTPKSGATLRVGGEAVVHWFAPASIKTVSLEFSIDDGRTWQPLSTNIPNDGTARIKLPADATAAAQLRISATVAGGSITDIATQLVLTAEGDVIPPAITIQSPTAGAVTGPTIRIAGTANDPAGIASVEIREAGETKWHPAIGHNTWIFTPERLTSGPCTFEIRARDLAIPANTSAPVQLSITVDADAPQIDALNIAVEGKQVVVTWTTDEPASSRIQWGKKPGIYEHETGVTEENVTSHRVKLKDYNIQSGPLYLIAISTDSCGNTSTSAELSFPK